jgi:hypothetical protein
MRASLVIVAATLSATPACGKGKSGGGGGAAATAADAGGLVMAKPMLPAQPAGLGADAGALIAPAPGPSAAPKPAGRHDLSRYDVPASVVLPEGFIVAAGMTERGESEATLKRDELEVLLTVAGVDPEGCKLDDLKAGLASGYPKHVVHEAKAFTRGYVAIYSANAKDSPPFEVGGCFEIITCQARVKTRADADVAAGICGSLAAPGAR